MKQLKLPSIKPEFQVIVSYKSDLGTKTAVIMECGGAYWWLPATSENTTAFGPFSKEEAVKKAKQWANA